MSTKTRQSDVTSLRPLMKEEIDRRIDALAEGLGFGPATERGAGSDLRPRWISAAELVERMRPFLVLN